MKNFIMAFWICVSVPTYALAVDTVRWKSMGQWEVMVDQTLGHGCFILASWDVGTVIRAGFNPALNSTYITFGDVKWKSIEVGKEYPLTIQFDKRTGWNGMATGIRFDGSDVNMLHASIGAKPADFFAQMAASHAIYIRYQGKVISNLRLTGSAAAVSEMINCQLAMRETGAGQDPFAEASTNGSDPFAR